MSEPVVTVKITVNASLDHKNRVKVQNAIDQHFHSQTYDRRRVMHDAFMERLVELEIGIDAEGNWAVIRVAKNQTEEGQS